MPSTDTVPDPAPTPPPTSPGGTGPTPVMRRLRRSRTDRVAAGVAGGLADYFRVDPVLFRVLFAASAFFGGAGVIAYLVAWAAIPEQGTERAVIDDWIGALRRRHVPPWLVAVGAGLLLWATAFSWWAPQPFWPVLVVVVVLLVLYGRRTGPSSAPTGTSDPQPADPASESTNAPTGAGVSLTKAAPVAGEARAWLGEHRAAARERRRRAFPVRIATLVTLAVTLVVLGAIDAVHGIALPLYFVFVGAIALTGLLVGVVARRTPWSLAALVAVSLIGLLGFGTTHASLHDGVGRRSWEPQSRPAASYRLAFGQATLDLQDLNVQDAPRTVHVTMAAGQVQVLASRTQNLTVHAYVRAGNVAVDRPLSDFRHGDGGFEYDRTIRPPAGATGQPITVYVHLADGNIDVQRQ